MRWAAWIFACRPVPRRKSPELGIRLLRAFLLTGAKASNLPPVCCPGGYCISTTLLIFPDSFLSVPALELIRGRKLACLGMLLLPAAVPDFRSCPPAIFEICALFGEIGLVLAAGAKPGMGYEKN